VLHLRHISNRLAALCAAFLLLAGLSIPVIVPSQAYAAGFLSNRSMTISSSAIGTVNPGSGTEGQGGNGARAKPTAKFNMATTTPTIGSILIMYCTSPVPQASCTTPTGLDASNITAATVTGLDQSTQSFSLDTTTSNSSINTALGSSLGVCNGASAVRTNCVALKRGTNFTETSGTLTVTVAYGGTATNYIINPTTVNYSFYARIFVFSGAGASSYTAAGLVDDGGVAASTAQQITITARVQERLDFSVGVSPIAPTSSCSPFTDNGALSLGDPSNGYTLSTSTTWTSHSYFRIDSNTANGTIVYYSGDTLKNGSNTITAINNGTPTTNGTKSTLGTRQFGLAIDQLDTQSGNGFSFTDLAANNNANIAAHPYDYSFGQGTVIGDLSGGEARFQFDTSSVGTPRPIAISSQGISCDTGSVRYMANISTNTPAGIYTTTITYIATGTY
jgi:hypothetical protein